MKHSFIINTFVSGLLLTGATAFAQDRDRAGGNGGEERYHQPARDDAWWRGHLFQRVREDLEHVQAVRPAFDADENRFVTTKQELNELQGKLDSHQCDQPELDRAIDGLEKVLIYNSLSRAAIARCCSTT